MMVGICLDCDEHIEIDDDAEVDEIVQCPKCRVRFEIVDLDPVVLDSVVAKQPKP